MRGYDILGNIAIVKFDRNDSLVKKKKEAKQILSLHKNVTTILEKSDKFKGRLRTLKTKFILGTNTKESNYNENNCNFRFNVETCYFSPRLSNERIEIAKMIKKNENVLVMFGGAGPFAVVIAKNSSCNKVTSVELGRECSKYALVNVKRNKLDNKVNVIQGDVRRICPKLNENAKKSGIFGASKTKSFEGYDRIVMARPNLTDSFLDVAFPVISKKGIIHYYGFYEESKIDELKNLILDEAKKAKKKIRVLKIKRAGDIGLRKYRYRVDFQVLN